MKVFNLNIFKQLNEVIHSGTSMVGTVQTTFFVVQKFLLNKNLKNWITSKTQKIALQFLAKPHGGTIVLSLEAVKPFLKLHKRTDERILRGVLDFWHGLR